MAAGAVDAQCVGPDVNNVVTCAAGAYGGISFTASNPGLTINIAAGASTTVFGAGATGNGTIVINGDPSDTFASTLNGVPGLYGVTTVGDVSLTGGDVSATNLPAVIAETDSGDVSINVGSATSTASVGIFVGSAGAGAPGNVSVTAGFASGPGAGVDIQGATGNVQVNVGQASSPSGPAIFAESGLSDVTINSGNVTAAGGVAPGFAEAIGGVAVNGTVTISSGNASFASGGPAAAVLAEASGTATVVSGNASLTTTDGYGVPGSGLFNAAATVVASSAAGNATITSGFASIATADGAGEAIYAQALSGSVGVSSGTAQATGNGTSGIYANAGGNVEITSSNITTNGDSVDEPGGITNATYAPTQDYPAGNLAAWGIFAVTSGGSINISTGNISTTGSDAIAVVANAATTNTITVNGAVSSAQAVGIALASGGSSTVTVESGASVSGVIGIDASGANTGLVVGNNTAGVQGGLNVIDDGTITGTGGTAIQFNPGANTLTLGTGWAINGAIVGGTNNSLILAGSVAVPTASQDAPSFTNFSSLEVKTGYWTLPSAASYANTTVDAAGGLEIDTSLAGNLTDNGEVVFNTPGDLAFAGAFSGDGELIKDGPGVLTFDGAYSFSGSTVIDNGSIDIADLAANATLDVTGGTLNVGGNATIADITGTGGTVNITGNANVGSLSGSSTLTVSSGDTVSVGGGDFSGNMSGGGSLEKTGNGTLTLAGNDSLGGNVAVGSGTVNVTGNLSAPQLAVDSGASLGGSGCITGQVTVEPGGVFSPGDPVTTKIIGNLMFAGGSTYLAQMTAGGAHDLIAVIGKVTLKKGSTFEADPLGNPATYANNTQYTVITATGGISGGFSNVISAAPLLSATLTYPNNEVVLKLKRNDQSFASQATTPDQAAAAAAVEAGGADSPLYTALVGQTAAGLRAGYASLSGEGYADAPSEILEQSDETRRTLLGRMDDRSAKLGLWMTNYGDWGGGDGGGSRLASTRSTLSGGETGYDWALGGWRLGMATGYGYDNLSVQARTTSSSDAFWTASSYAAFDRGALDVKLGATYSWHRLSALRDVVFPGFAEANSALAHPSSGEAFGEMSWRAAMRGASWVGPFVGVSVDQVGGWSLAEAGGASALNVTTDSRTLLSTRLGLQGQAALPFAPGLVAHAALDWRYASGDLVGAAHMVFESTGASFTVRGLPIAASTAEVTAGVAGKLAPNTTLDVSYHAEAGDHFSDNAFKLAASWRF